LVASAGISESSQLVNVVTLRRMRPP
jgi:hypothetical protein